MIVVSVKLISSFIHLLSFKTSATIIIFDFLRNIKKLKKNGFNLKIESIRDPKVAAWLIEPELLGNLASFVQTYVPEIMDHNKPRDTHLDSYYAFQLMRAMKKRLQKVDLFNYFEQVEMPLHHSLQRIEFNGITFDEEHFEDIQNVFSNRISEIEMQGNRAVNFIPFSWDSSKELFDILFLELELPHPDIPNPDIGEKTKKFVNKSLLERIVGDNQFPKLIIERNRLSFIVSQFITPIAYACDRDVKTKTCKIHCIQDPFTVINYN